MHTIVIFGNSGSGKSTLASEMAEILACSHLDLDTIAWKCWLHGLSNIHGERMSSRYKRIEDSSTPTQGKNVNTRQTQETNDDHPHGSYFSVGRWTLNVQ